MQSLIGRGGMGLVYKAHHDIIDHDYALKILIQRQFNEANWKRFIAEARAIARLDNANIVKIFNMGLDVDNSPYYVMELLGGQSLADDIRATGPLTEDQALQIFALVADGLDCAHKNGIIHRDVKPSNIMVESVNGSRAQVDLNVKIVDFGIARLNVGAQYDTAVGEIFGSPLYMSPEQCQGLPVDKRSDIYSFGCTLFEALTGRPPFHGASALETFGMHLSATPPALSEAGGGRQYDPSLEVMVRKMLKKDPRERYQSMSQVQHDFERVVAGKPVAEEAAQGGTSIDTSFSLGQAFRNPKLMVWAKSLAIFYVVALIATGGWFFFSYKKAKENTIPIVDGTKDQSKAEFTGGTAKNAFASAPVTTIVDGKKMRRFEFPAAPIALYSIDGVNYLPAQGIVLTDFDKPLHLELSSGLDNPIQTLKKFGPNDVCDLRICTDALPAVVDVLASWQKLDQLKLKRCFVEDADWKCLDRLKHLRALGLDKCPDDTSVLTSLNCIQKLDSISLDRLNNMVPILQALSKSKSLHVIEIRSTRVLDQSFLALAAMPSLRELKVVVPEDVYSKTNLKLIAGVKSLKTLTLLKRNWVADGLDYLAKTKPKALKLQILDEMPAEERFY